MYRPAVGFGFFSRRYAIAIVLTVLTLWIIRDRGPDIETIRDFAQLGGGAFGSGDGWVSQRQFVRRALEDDIYVSPYNGTAVRDVCSRAKWREGLFISCDDIAGGIGNLKMRLLGCTRYAIEAGATLITPVIHPRQAFEKMQDSFGWDVDLPLDYMFDSDHFYGTLARDCPQLRIVNETAPGLHIPPRDEAHRCLLDGLVPKRLDHVVIDAGAWRPAFDRWLDREVHRAERQKQQKKPQAGDAPAPSADRPVRVSLDEWVQFSWPHAHDGDGFRNDWGHAARPRRYVRRLAARALHALYARAGCLGQDPRRPSRSCFLGAHFRTEADARAEGWDSYEAQARHAREQLATHNLSVLYVATGTAGDVDRLRADLAGVRVRVNETHERPVEVLHKWDLLGDDDVMLMDTLTWDQMALVDLDIMLRASRFEGIWESSWAWMIALKRHEWSDDEDPFAHGITFEDGLSRLYGNPGMQAFIPETMYL